MVTRLPRGADMPYFSENSVVYVIEDILRDHGVVNEIIARIASGCKCSIIDSPFAATLTVKGFVVERVVGVGSVVCEPRCSGSKGSYRIVNPTWGQGRVVRRGLECLYHGPPSYRAQLAGLGLRVVDTGFHSLVEMSTKKAMHGVAIIDNAADLLEVEELPGTCGRLGTPNPLHPASAFGKPGVYACAEPLYQLVGPLGRLTQTLLYISDTSKPVISRIEGIGSALLIQTDLGNASRNIQVAATLGMLYECGAAEEYM